MSLPFDISEKLKIVQVRHYVEWLGRDSHCGYGFAFGYDEKSYRLIDELFQMLQDVETDDEDGAKELWLCARRGTIDDFAKQYGTYEENLEDGTVKNQKEYEDYWKSEFPDEVEWYRFVAVEHTDIKYRCVFLSNKQVLEMDKRLESGYTHDISEFTEWLVDAVKLTIEAVRNGTYNESVARLLPYKHRTGVITRAGLWKLYPEEKESFFEALTQEDVDEFLATGTEDCTGLPELKEMTANDFYRFCALGYAANNYDGQAFALKAQYYRHADGRDDGLKKIDPDSAEAFAGWLENREKGGHPWEVCRGGNSTHVSLYVGLGRVAEGCYHLALAAKSYGRCVEAIKFYLALKHAGLPVIIYGAEFIKKRLLGLERVGIVPNEVMPFYCHSRFPGEDVDSFRHLNHENPDAEIALIEWQPIKPVKLKENARPSQILCKPPMWCRIEAPHRRFYIWPERIVLQKKTPGGRKSENCCRWQTSAAWMTFRACLRRQSQNSWRMAWKQSWMMNWATASMTTRTRTQITAATVTVIKHCGPASEM